MPRIAVTIGEPAGIGPDVVLELATEPWDAEIVAFGDADVLASRARQLGRNADLQRYDPTRRSSHQPHRLPVVHVPLAAPCAAGTLDARNGAAVLEMLRTACAACLAGEFDALVTAPVHKGIINDAGLAFSGHTEFFAALTNAPTPVMLLVADRLRVGLVTTHLPLSKVPEAITRAAVESTLRVLADGLTARFGIRRPRIIVLGLNPHAGESGHLGREEIDTIIPAVNAMRSAGVDVAGPVPADTAFVAPHLDGVDAVLAMYHDQGLPVLKHSGFGRAVNVTLGLPIVRTSVDHGTALDLAGSGRADAGSLRQALRLAIDMAGRARSEPRAP